MVKDPTDKVIVCIKAYKPSFLDANLTTLVTLITLIILAIYGPIENASLASAAISDIPISTKLEITMKQSNLF